MADKNKFVKPELKKYSAKKLLTQDILCALAAIPARIFRLSAGVVDSLLYRRGYSSDIS